VVTPTARRTAVGVLEQRFAMSERRACTLMALARSTCRYHAQAPDRGVVRERLQVLAHARPRFGYRRLHVLLRREGFRVNHKCVYRLYRAEGLAVRRKRRKRVAGQRGPVVAAPTAVNEHWSMDFMGDSLADGRTFRTLNIVDDFSREALAIVVDTSLPGTRVVRVLEELAETRGLPALIIIDNGPEFAGQALDEWAYRRGVHLHFITPGKPVENAYIESFNGKFRDECLNEHWFMGLEHARELIEAWRIDYNHVRPHSSLDNATPEEFARAHAGLRSPTAPSAPHVQGMNTAAGLSL
jgi:putative transposase